MGKSSVKLVNTLFADRGDDLLRYLSSRLPNKEDARDLAQETYLRLLRRDRVDLVRHPEAYLFRIAANLMYEHWLKKRPEADARGSMIDPDSLMSDNLSTEETVANQQSIDALHRVLRVLPPKQQQVVLMHRRDGLTYGEMAEKLGISVGMVKKHLAKGLARCREQLLRYRDE